ncbi:hypothetical protein KR222_005030 [Zaprionus bogoriensis]|nr:hypothetical protein KR222_005030 [Zaprionus bogoriensis]
MLRYIQNLPLGQSPTAGELAAIGASIYRQFFENVAGAQQLNGERKEPAGSLLEGFDAQPSNQAEHIAATADDVWIFGYGSLVWKADFPYIDRRRGYVCGYKRRFYQHSIDHRGVPERPGRVVTLLPGDVALDRVYGVAYRIAAAQKAQVLGHLDYREKNGYERFNLQFHEYPAATMPIEVIIYMATQANDSYAGHVWQVPCIARQIFTSAGPSGPNREYLFNLSIAMRQLFPDVVDEHLAELVHCVQALIEQEEPALLERAIGEEILSVLHAALDKQQGEQQQQLELELVKRLEALRQRLQAPGTREKLLSQQLQRAAQQTDS